MHVQQKRYRLNVPERDEEVMNWLDMQSNLSFSVRLLIKDFISRNGFVDATCVSVAQQSPNCNVSVPVSVNNLEVNNIEETLQMDEMKKKRGRPKGSVKTEVQETEDVTNVTPMEKISAPVNKEQKFFEQLISNEENNDATDDAIDPLAMIGGNTSKKQPSGLQDMKDMLALD